MEFIDFVLVGSLALVTAYFIGIHIPLNMESPKTSNFEHSFNGSTGNVEMVFTDSKSFGSAVVDGNRFESHIGRVYPESGDSFKVKLAADEKGFLELVALCQHELRHVEFDLMNRNPGYVQEEILIGHGFERRTLRYDVGVQLLNFRPKCYGLAAGTVKGL